MQLIDLKSQCINLYSVLQELGYENSADWFRVASGIENVEFDGMIRDNSFIMCEPAYDYEVERNNLHTKIVNQIVSFNFIWSGLESLIDEMNISPCPSRNGKINKACFYLKSEYEPLSFSLRYFDDLSLKLLGYLKTIKSPNLIDSYKLSDCVGKTGTPLHAIYKLRNQFAHGVFNFPEPADWNYDLKEPQHAELINTSSILVLMSIQMLLIGKFKGKEIIYCPYEACLLEEDEESMLISDYLKILHIQKEENDDNPDQLTLELT